MTYGAFAILKQTELKKKKKKNVLNNNHNMETQEMKSMCVCT